MSYFVILLVNDKSEDSDGSFSKGRVTTVTNQFFVSQVLLLLTVQSLFGCAGEDIEEIKKFFLNMLLKFISLIKAYVQHQAM